MRIHIDFDLLPLHVQQSVTLLEANTNNNNRFQFNVCLSYSSRHEIVNACNHIIRDIKDGLIDHSNSNNSNSNNSGSGISISDSAIISGSGGVMDGRISNNIVDETLFNKYLLTAGISGMYCYYIYIYIYIYDDV